MPGPIDLHAHSSVSDGTETPEQLVASAVEAGLGVVALTDHDSTAGWDEAFRAAAGTGLTVVPGLELSTQVDEFRTVHLLGYLVDPENAELRRATEAIRGSRLGRAERIVERIARDYSLSWEDVLDQTMDGTTIGRPHIADALVARGHVADRGEAFAGILNPRSPYYEPHRAPTPLEGVMLIRAAGGVPVMAHPATRGRGRMMPEAYLSDLVDYGLAGLEVDHPENLPDGMELLRVYARRYDLIVTGSSDYHGEGKPNRLGQCVTSPEAYERLVAEGSGSAPFTG